MNAGRALLVALAPVILAVSTKVRLPPLEEVQTHTKAKNTLALSKLFELLDKNQDKKLSTGELEVAAEEYGTADLTKARIQDGDGFLDRSEWSAFVSHHSPSLFAALAAVRATPRGADAQQRKSHDATKTQIDIPDEQNTRLGHIFSTIESYVEQSPVMPISEDLEFNFVGCLMFSLFLLIACVCVCVGVGRKIDSSEQSSDDADASHAQAASEVELIRNPTLLAWFKALVYMPQQSSLGLAVLICLTLAISTRYTILKNTPIELDPMDTHLKDAQMILRHQYPSAPRSTMNIEVLTWSDEGATTSTAEVSKSLKAVVRVLATMESSCESLKWEQEEKLPSTDKIQTSLSLHVTPSSFTTPNYCLAALRPLLVALGEQHAGLHVSMASANAVIDASLEASDKETWRDCVISGPLMAILLILGVGNVFRALTPLLCWSASLLAVRSSLVLIKYVWWDLNFANPDTPIMFILLALCFDYGLFFWSRFSQERRAHPEKSSYASAIECALRTSGFVITLSTGILVVTAVIGSLYPGHNETGYLGQSLQQIVGFLCAGFYSLAVPAVLAALFPSLFDEGNEPDQSFCSAAWGWIRSWVTRPDWTKCIASFVVSSPWKFLVPIAVFAFFTPCLVVLKSSELNYDRYEAFASRTVPEYTAHQILKEKSALGNFTEAFVLMEAIPVGNVTSKGGPGASNNYDVKSSTDFSNSVCSLIQSIIEDTKDKPYQIDAPHIIIHGQRSQTNLGCGGKIAVDDHKDWISLDGKSQLLTIYGKMSMAGAKAKALTETFWNKLEPEATQRFSAGKSIFEFRATFDMPLAEDMLTGRSYWEWLPWIIVATVFSTCCIVSYCFSSAFVAFKLLFTVVIPLLAEYGFVVGVYQHGWLEPLGIHRMKGVWWMVPFGTTGVLFALAMDYDLFLFARVYERRMGGYDNTSAVRLALEETGPIITLAGTMMNIAFLFLFLNSLPSVGQIGCLYFFGVAIDTYIIRLFMAPAVLCIYGPMNFWPSTPPQPSKSYDGSPESGC